MRAKTKFANGVIYKYPLEVTDYQTIQIPEGFEILCIQTQNEIPCIWCYVNASEKDLEDVYIEIYGTGHDIKNDLFCSREYIGTFQLENGSLVFHAFITV